MRYDVIWALAAVLAVTPLAAQVADQQPPEDPVEATEAPEDEAREVTEDRDALPPAPLPTPSPAPNTAASTAPAPSAPTPAKWDVNAPPGATIRQVPINVTEGTWINLDVSPDGRTILFDLLGDIYTLPIGGGTATRIAEGLAFETHPRWSPDGRRIAFTSDRGGGDNIWIMNADGSDKRQLTRETFRLLNQPTWSPDGRFIAAKKHFTTGRSLGTGEVWLYHVSGGEGVPLVERPNPQHQKELGEPTYAPDGRGIYFVRNTTPGPIFEYAQDSNTELFAIERYDIDSGETEEVTGGPGGAVRPAPSPDGKWLAFVRREATESKLYVRNLETGEERKIYDALDKDMQETWAVHGVYPNMSWTPNSRSILFWAGGQIRRISPDGGEATVIPFRVTDSRGVIDPPRNAVDLAPAEASTAMVRFAEVSPDGRQVVFESLGKLWIRSTSGNAAPRRLTRGGDGFELFPSWSRDGRRIAFVRWTDRGLGELRTIGAAGGAETLVVDGGDHFARPRFSPDGETLLVEVNGGGRLVSDRQRRRSGTYLVPAAGGSPVRVEADLSAPHFADRDDRIYGMEAEGDTRRLVSVARDGSGKRVHASGELINGFRVSPDGQFFAFSQNYDAWVEPMLPGTQAVGAGRSATALPVTRVSGSGAEYIHWSNNGRTINWSLGPTLYSAPVDRLFRQAPAAAGETPPRFEPPRDGLSLAMSYDVARPSGRVALTGARIVTMAAADGGVIDDGVILIDGDRIQAVGPRASTPIPAGTRTIDLAGKTVIPGLVDAHAHGPYGSDEIIPQQNWAQMVNLAMGVTTIHDPSSQASEVFAASEYQRAGLILAPRTMSTGEIVYGARAPGVYAQIDGLDDARAHVRRLRAQGGRSVKNYNQPRRDQRQQVVAASREERMNVVAEGGSLFGMDMTLIADGNTTLEHNIPQLNLYEDVLSFFSQTRVGYTPTLVVTYGGLAGDPYWRAHTNVFEQPVLRRHEPPAVLLAANARRSIAPDAQYVDDDSAREARKLAQRGVPVSIGAHGQEAGIGAHWELWSFVRGGMTPVEALAAGTIVSARSLGYDRDVGSLEAGKLADLVVLDADPLTDIRNSERVSQVMLGGRLYDAATLNETGTGNRQRLPYWWE
ncbi:imidazolonepropionase-like amidohydrolase/Tol biopolymer transport system component [Sphingomonas jejuensis]|uniref:Imidazolonepropionase-like amidohydrolase/Tol biopolymer transport system component n=1 Tax=Sphingomonas jejuensis TaxID=904715 RepID=A0ABX0XJK3_9SPHN|nr:amidohydrolase family protein [Sphingomonas jejuensis]NJC33420.1 imidazolonepropionase-like amidohydrolase/Tol biopolymer transport system component [Sphingomonas jejuensis]